MEKSDDRNRILSMISDGLKRCPADKRGELRETLTRILDDAISHRKSGTLDERRLPPGVTISPPADDEQKRLLVACLDDLKRGYTPAERTALERSMPNIMRRAELRVITRAGGKKGCCHKCKQQRFDYVKFLKPELAALFSINEPHKNRRSKP